MSIQDEIDRMMELDEFCHQCDGDGSYYNGIDHDGPVKCSGCKGCGRRPTEFGQKVLDFVKKHAALGGTK